MTLLPAFDLDPENRQWFKGQLPSPTAAAFRAAKPQEPGKPHTLLPPFNLAFNVSDPNAIKWAKEHGAELAKDLSDVTEQAVRDAIAKAYEGGNLDKAFDDILDAVGDEARAEMITRTETMFAANEGQRASWEQAVDAGLLPPNAKREWIATNDSMPPLCEDCAELDGQVAELGEQYPDPGADGPPLHPNCRCTEGITE